MRAPSERETLYEHKEQESELARDGKAESRTDASVGIKVRLGLIYIWRNGEWPLYPVTLVGGMSLLTDIL